MSIDSDGSDKRTGMLGEWWKRRGPLTRAFIIVLGITIWSAAAYSYGYDNGLGGAIDDEKDSFQLSIVNYTIQKDEYGYEIQGEIQNNYDKPIWLIPRVEVKGFDSNGEMVLHDPIFITSSEKIRPGEKVKFRGEGIILEGYSLDDIIIGIKTECSGNEWA
ncbi:hypothetical protein [Methanothermobacter sp.]|uniref:hypothetical protein n=1 Tax=Methanothermobacter sp. TaxID=1884223 RepID=UPI003C76D440